MCWKTAKVEDLSVVKNFINDGQVFELIQPIKTKTAEIRRALKIKLPDAIIAATAIVYGLVLLTHNVRDFSQIEGLQIIDPLDVG